MGSRKSNQMRFNRRWAFCSTLTILPNSRETKRDDAVSNRCCNEGRSERDIKARTPMKHPSHQRNEQQRRQNKPESRHQVTREAE